MPMDDKTKHKVDRWVRKSGRNEFGDPPGTVYAGGTPLFNERTGRNEFGDPPGTVYAGGTPLFNERTGRTVPMPIDDETKHRVDRWVRENGRNEFGDPPSTVYAGGTPLFNETTGRSVDRYEYILKRHPELRGS